MDLDLADVKLTKIVTCTVEGIVELDDLRILTAPPGTFSSSGLGTPAATSHALEEAEDPSSLKKVREKHHSVARLIAGGMQQSLVASLSGYTDSYLSILLNNPAMEELIDLYRTQRGAAAAVVTEKLQTVGLKAVEKLEARLDADQLSNQDMLSFAKLGLDRGGHGPSSTKHNVQENHTIDHAALLELRRKALSDSKEFIVPVSEVRAALTGPTTPAIVPSTDLYSDPDLED